MKKALVSMLMCTLLLIGVILPLVFADVPLTSRFDEVGNYGVASAGVGLRDTLSGDITIDVPGTVVVAYLYWAGIDESPGGDNTAVFDGSVVTADETYGPETWYNQYYHYVYIEDVTTLVDSGLGTYIVAGIEGMFYLYGAGLVVVYEDPSLPDVRILLMDGLDGFWFDWESPLGPNSEVTGFEFDSSTSEREAEMFLFVGGTEHDDRPNEIWTQTGTGTTPTDIITSSTSPEGSYPLVGGDGSSWDTFSDTVGVAAGDEWLGVQVESIDSWESPLYQEPLDGRGTSALVIAAGFALPVEFERPEGLSPGFWKHNVRVALDYPGEYSVPHEGELRLSYETIKALAETVTGETGTVALEQTLSDLTAKGPGSESVRLEMANEFNAAAGYAPYSE